ncbi:MAG: hypothetical protein JNJ61_02675 [Anaerolineae bacterium]|nr:hypothetical protein [Anaerolineae bacterium]
MLPGSEALAARLGVRHLKGDALRHSDLLSAAAYRRALHRALVQRRPGQYPRRWLARRLGVSEWTLRRYEQIAGISTRPMYAMQPLRALKVDELLTDDVHDPPHGVFLEDEQGKRYPPLRTVALKLIGQGGTPRLMRQEPSYYSFGAGVGIPTPTHDLDRATSAPFLAVDTPDNDWQRVSALYPPQSARGDRTWGRSEEELPNRLCHEPSPTVGIPTPALRFWLCPECLRVHVQPHTPDSCRCGSAQWELVSESIWRHVERLKSWWRKRFAEHQRRTSVLRKPPQVYPGSHPMPVSEDERMAQRAHSEVGGLALSSARLLVERYGARAVGEGMRLLKQRSNVYNPAGLLTVIARCEHKFYSSERSNENFTAAPA